MASEIEAKVAAIAESRGADKSDVVREAVIRFVQRYEAETGGPVQIAEVVS